MNFWRPLLIVCAMAVATPGPIYAQTEKLPEIKQIKLTREMVEDFLRVGHELLALRWKAIHAKKPEGCYLNCRQATWDSFRPQFQRVFRKTRTIRSFEQFDLIAESAFIACRCVHLKKHIPTIRRQLKFEAMKELPEIRWMLRRQLALIYARPLPGNEDVVRPYRPAIVEWWRKRVANLRRRK
jgi:hypothetical protein